MPHKANRKKIQNTKFYHKQRNLSQEILCWLFRTGMAQKWKKGGDIQIIGLLQVKIMFLPLNLKSKILTNLANIAQINFKSIYSRNTGSIWDVKDED